MTSLTQALGKIMTAMDRLKESKELLPGCLALGLQRRFRIRTGTCLSCAVRVLGCFEASGWNP